MKILKIILIVIISLIAVIAIIGLFLPSKMHIERTIKINSTASVVFNQVNNLKNFYKWSPWSNLDTSAIFEYEGPETGTGAIMKWSSKNENVGIGKMKIIESIPSSFIKLTLDFGQEGLAFSEWKFAETNGVTTVTWIFHTDFGMNILARYFGFLMRGMIEKDYDNGLDNLKKYVETLAKPNIQISIENLPERNYILINDSTKSISEISGKLGQIFGEVIGYLNKNRIAPSGPPIAITNSFNQNSWNFEAGFPISTKLKKVEGRLRLENLSAGKYLKAVYIGPYEESNIAYEYIFKHIAENKLEITGRSWEQYLNDPVNTPKKDLITNIYFPIK